MKRILFFIPLLAVVMLACSITTATETPVITEPPATEPPVTEPPVVVTDTPVVTEPPIVNNVTCNELSIYLDPALASGYNCETVPESTFEMEIHPQYTNLTLLGYVLSDKFFEAHISVFPVQRYTELLPDFIPADVAALQALVVGGPTGDTALPFLPVFNAAQVFHAQYLVLPFTSGGGIRYLTLYAQYYAPVNNHDLFYTYQGLTSDGQYWISAILPINHPILPAGSDPLPGGVTFEEFSNNYESYITDMINQLNAQTSDSYTPTLAALDALAASITIQP